MKRIASLSILLCLLASNLFAESSFFRIKKFDGGLNSHASVWSIPENQVSDAQNVRFNATYGAVAKRPPMLTYGTIGSNYVSGLHRYYKSDGTEKLIAAGGTGLYVGDDSAGTFQAIGSDFTDGKRWQFATYADVAIGWNGFEQPIKYDGKTQITANTDGSRSASNLVAQLGAPFAELNTGSNLDASSWYQYRVAFYNGSVYTHSLARSNAIQTGSGVRDITLTDIPLGPTGTTQRVIYRTEGKANKAAVEAETSFYRVGTISDNTTRTYNDTVDDTTLLGDSAPTWATASAGVNVTPPKAKYGIIHKERLFLARAAGRISDVFYSDTFNPNYFDPEDYETFRPDDGDEITFLKEFLGILTIGKTNGIFKYYTDAAEGEWVVSDTLSLIGCPAPYTADVTPKGIVYLTREGLYIWSGQSATLLSDAVTPQMRDILQTNFDRAAGFYFKDEYRLSYTSIESGAANNNRILIFNFTRNAYTLDFKSVNAFAALSSGNDFGDLYLGSSTTDGKVFIDEGESSFLSKRYKSDFDAGTYDDTRSYNTEVSPIIELAWDVDIDGWNAYGATINDLSGIIDRPDTAGTWTSPVYEINASSLIQIFWNEDLNGTGDVTFQVRTGATEAATLLASWSTAVSDPNGSNLTAVTANNYIQVRANLSTTDITKTPELFSLNNYLFRVAYLKGADTQEASFYSFAQTGWLNFGTPGYPKTIKRIRVFYEGTEGEFEISYKNIDGDVEKSFTIDKSIEPPYDSDGDNHPEYKGFGGQKVYLHRPSYNQLEDPSAMGSAWMFTVSDTSTDAWKLHEIEVEFETESIHE